MDSVTVPIARRRALWDRLATDLRPRELGRHVTEVDLDGLDVALDGIVAGTRPRPLDRPRQRRLTRRSPVPTVPAPGPWSASSSRYRVS